MHPRNVYLKGIDFLQLSNNYPSLKNYLDSHNSIDFKHQEAQRCLTEALLYCDFRLNVKLPSDRLCPPHSTKTFQAELCPMDTRYIVHCLRYLETQDVNSGTGASAIYPLLGCALEKSWTFVASENDRGSFGYACENISANHFDSRIHVVQAKANSPILLPLFLDAEATFDFTMCNPPFYSSVEDVVHSAEAKQFGPNAVCTGAEVEMFTPGGEAVFVGKMVEESSRARHRCRWYTSMLGKLSSVEDIVNTLKSHSIDNYIVTEFVQGQTRRWAVGWSFLNVRLPDSVSRIPNPNPTISKCLPAHNTITQSVPDISKTILAESLHQMLSSISHLNIQSRTAARENTLDADMTAMDVDDSDVPDIIIFAQEDTWSRSARRRRNQVPLDATSSMNPSVSSTPLLLSLDTALVCSIHIKDLPSRDVNSLSGSRPTSVMFLGHPAFDYTCKVANVLKKIRDYAGGMIDQGPALRPRLNCGSTALVSSVGRISSPIEHMIPKRDGVCRSHSHSWLSFRPRLLVFQGCTGPAGAPNLRWCWLLSSGSDLEVKFSFPSDTREPEDALVNRNIAKGATNHPHLLHDCLTVSFGLGTVQYRLKEFFNERKKSYEVRVLRIAIFEKPCSLDDLKTPEEAAQVFYDILQVHNWLYTEARILHRDLSMGNIMFRRVGGKVYGVLNDFDLSSFLPFRDELSSQ
ncbi:hypothetical protein D9757_008617 [Collybiopsis confluens]|uniref:Protein kinase domain-containing protein n=1 Tax=Collybiopsis confluens TaxID=2823264 RepID=A0A8H5MA44_9AGAR|nr:hypothetical protein D9757_012688 [Collybiopsis confluens]KAF5386319.1 hypothetical protein D9757_008617 [Collybiopsis confluens]